MKIQIEGGGRDFSIVLPDGLMFNRATLWLANSVGRKYAPEAMAGISPEAMEALFAELKRIKKKHGSWELVEVRSADGECVKITL